MTPIVLVIAIFLFILCLLLGYLLVKARSEFRRYREEELSRREEIRQEAIRESRRVLGGKFTEQMAPYLPEFKYDPTEARFIGSPIDLVVFPGLAQEDPTELVLIEVKTGKNDRLTPKEKRIREIIEAGRVRWELLYRPQLEG
jgi:predicted Holliday junction resolvase-like endonuclease